MASEFDAARKETLDVLREVASLADAAGATSLSHRLRDDRIPRLEAGRFHLVILGEFNHGKSTFVNALLGADVLPTGVTPTTAAIHHITYGAEPSAVAVFPDGKRQPVSLGELSAHSVGATEGVELIEVQHPSPLLQEGVVLVDTPGVNDLNEARAEITYGYVPRSDAVLFLLDAGQILKESERAFVAGKLLAASRDKVLFLVNKLDLLTPQEREEALAYAKANLGRLVDAPRVYGVSARQALEGDGQRAGLDVFLADLKTFLEEERGRVVIDNALDEGLRTARTLRTGLEVQRQALTMEQEELERRLAALERDLDASAETMAARERSVREDVAAVKALVREDVMAFARRFAAALPDEIEASEARDLRRYLTGFIEERFREFAEAEGEVVTRKLEKVAEEAIAFVAEDARAQAKRLEEALGPAAPRLDLDVSTFAYDVGVFALGAFGLTLMALSNVVVGGALALSAPVVAWLVRGRVDKQVKARAAEEAPKVVIEAAGKMADAFEARIDEFGDALVDFITKAGQELTRSIAEVVRKVRDARARGEAERNALESQSGMALARLADLEQRIETMRSRLFGNGRDPRAVQSEAG